jgi:hypothetical protein
MKWVWIVIGLCAAILIVGLVIGLAGCEPPPPSDVVTDAGPARVETPRQPIQPERAAGRRGEIREPPLPMRYKWDVARHPGKARGVCTTACERIGMEFHATERADTEVGWRCLCGL